MNKITGKLLTLLITASIALSTAACAFAAGSPTTGNTTPETTIVTKPAKKSSEVKVVSAKSRTGNLFIAGKQNGKYVKVIAGKTINDKKYDKITLECYKRTRVKANVLGKKSRKTKTVVITKAKTAKKLIAKRFNKKAFKGYKGKIVVRKSAMTKKQYRLLKKKLKAGGFKGKMYYRK